MTAWGVTLGFFAVAIPMASASRPFSIVAILEEPARRREGLTNAPALANSVAAPGRPAAAPEAPLLGSLNLTPAPLLYDSSGNGVINADDKEQYQTEISTTVSLAGRMFVISSGGGPTLQVSDATNAAEISLVARSSLNGYTSQSVASYGNLLAVGPLSERAATTRVWSPKASWWPSSTAAATPSPVWSAPPARCLWCST